MLTILKLNNHLEDTKVSVPFTKPFADIYLFLKYYFALQQNNPDPGF